MSDRTTALALRIVRRLHENGCRALFAGGCVRDRLLGLDTHGDIDIASSATPDTVSRLFAHTIGVGAHFGVVIVVEEGVPFEVATFRSDVGVSDGRHPAGVVFTGEREDALRRDFTINGMFFDPLTDTVLDYIGGQDDLRAGIVRAIGDAPARLREDYLRMLRAVRFTARFDFTLDSATFDAIKLAAGEIKLISAERVFQELDKMLRGPRPGKALELLHASGLLAHVLPEVAALDGVEQPKQFHPEGDVLRHTVLALSHLENPSQTLAWSVLLHDIGKPSTMRIADRIRFNNHDQVGAVMATAVLERLRAPRALIDSVTECVANHMHFMHVKNMRLSTLKRFLSRETIDDEMELHRVDCLSSHGELDNYDLLKGKRSEVAAEVLKPKPLLRGKDLLEIGFRPGPQLGATLHEAYELQLEEQLLSHEQALTWARERFARSNT